MSKESIPQQNARVLEEERKGTADKLAEQDAIRLREFEASAEVVKHDQGKNAKSLKDQADENAKNLKDQAKANAEKLKL